MDVRDENISSLVHHLNSLSGLLAKKSDNFLMASSESWRKDVESARLGIKDSSQNILQINSESMLEELKSNHIEIASRMDFMLDYANTVIDSAPLAESKFSHIQSAYNSMKKGYQLMERDHLR